MPTLFLIRLFPLCVALTMVTAPWCAPPAWAADDAKKFTRTELDQMLAPVALYPDTLLTQILMASTYPLEVVEAARWSKEHGEPKGDDAVRRVADKDWDPSVKSLCAFPHVLIMMDKKLEWTERLGDAYLAQEGEVMDAVQGLRRKAYDAGNLRSNERIVVTSTGETIVIAYASPTIVYVPYYDPFWVYGPWWWHGYPPYYWDPWPGYYYPSGVRIGFIWGVSYNVRIGFFFGSFDWHRRCSRVVYVHHYHYYYPRIAPRYVSGAVWVHDPVHRRGVKYRHPVVRERFRRFEATPDARGARDLRPRRDDQDRRGKGRPDHMDRDRPSRDMPRDRAVEPERRGRDRPDREKDTPREYRDRSKPREDRPPAMDRGRSGEGGGSVQPGPTEKKRRGRGKSGDKGQGR